MLISPHDMRSSMLRAFQQFQPFFPLLRRRLQPLDILPHHRDPHRDVEPVQVVLRLRVQVQLHVANVHAPSEKNFTCCSSVCLAPSTARRVGAWASGNTSNSGLSRAGDLFPSCQSSSRAQFSSISVGARSEPWRITC